jgi:hypothetical protein
MRIPRTNHISALLPGGGVLVAGGFSSFLTGTSELYDPATETWTATGFLSAGRQFALVSVLHDGKVLIAGGGTFGTDTVPLTELFDPETNMWSSPGPLHEGRIFHTMTLLSNGKVLVVGGVGSGGTLRTAELYDPATGQWRLTGQLATERLFHTATLLSDGRVLVSGGSSSFDTHDETSLDSAELYDPVTELWIPAGRMSLPRGGHVGVTRRSCYLTANSCWQAAVMEKICFTVPTFITQSPEPGLPDLSFTFPVSVIPRLCSTTDGS